MLHINCKNVCSTFYGLSAFWSTSNAGLHANWLIYRVITYRLLKWSHCHKILEIAIIILTTPLFYGYLMQKPFTYSPCIRPTYTVLLGDFFNLTVLLCFHCCIYLPFIPLVHHMKYGTIQIGLYSLRILMHFAKLTSFQRIFLHSCYLHDGNLRLTWHHHLHKDLCNDAEGERERERASLTGRNRLE